MFNKIILAGMLAGACAAAQAGVIVGAVGAVAETSGPGFGMLQNTFNQAGLASGYTSGVSDFASYIGANPLHGVGFEFGEWFGNFGTTSARVTYELERAITLQGVALWNEDSAGITRLNISSSLDGVDFTPVLVNALLVDNPGEVPYGPSVFAFAPLEARFVRFDAMECPQSGAFISCAFGEVAFDAAVAPTGVPEPAPWLLFGAAALAASAARRRTR